MQQNVMVEFRKLWILNRYQSRCYLRNKSKTDSWRKPQYS